MPREHEPNHIILRNREAIELPGFKVTRIVVATTKCGVTRKG